MTDCPPDDTLREYLNDSLPPDRAGPVTGHIDDCATCQQRLDTLTSESGQLANRLKAVRPTMPTLLGGDAAVPHPRGQIRQVLPVVPGYVLQEELGRGGMGVVYKALHKRLNRPTAIKMVLAGGLADPRITQRFLFEAEVLGRVRHPQVVQVYEVSMYAAPTGVTIPFLAMEYLDGGTLADWSDGRQHPPKAAAALVEGLARAVQVAHAQGVIHRDLKPANILRAADGTFKVTDFGLAKLTADTGGGLTGTGTVVGTPAYMAPEQASGEKGIGPPADVYSLGAILFELLTGRPPFDGAEPMSVLLKVIRDQPPEVRAVRADVPRDLSAVVARCLTKEPHRRYASAAELADDLRRFCDARPTRARAHGTAERLWYWSRRNPGTAAMLSALLLVAATAFVSVMILWRRAETDATAMGQAFAAARRQSAEVERQRDEAGKQRRTADRQGAYLAFDQAVHWCENGQLDDGLRGFVRALELAERTDEAELVRVIRVNVAAWDRALYPAGKLFRHPADAALTASGFSPDGKWVFAAGHDTVRVWDADTGERVAALTDAASGHVTNLLKVVPFTGDLVDPPSIRAVAISRDRTRVAATLSCGDVVVWTVPTAKPIHTFRATAGGRKVTDLWAAEFDADGRLWVGGDGGLLARFDVATGKPITVLPLPTWRNEPTSVQSLRLSGDGKVLFTGDRAGRLIEWDWAAGTESNRTSVGGWIGDIAVTSDGRGVAVASTAGAAVVRFRDQGGWALPTNGAYAHTVQFVADGRLLVLGDQDGKARLWDTATRATVGGPLRLGLNTKRVVARPGRPELLVPTAAGVRLQPLSPPAAVPVESPDAFARVRALDYSADGGRLLVGAGRLNIFDTATGKFVAVVPLDEETLCGRYLAGGKRILFGLRSGWGVFDSATGRMVSRTESGKYVELLPSSPSGDYASAFVGLRFRTVTAGGAFHGVATKPVGLDFRRSPPSAACLTPGGREVRFSTADVVHFHDLETGRATRAPIRAADEIRALAQTPDGTEIVTGLRDNRVQAWEVATGVARYSHPPRHEMAVTTVAVSRDGRTILSGSRDQTARYWDLNTGLILGPVLRHADAVTLVAFSPLGDRVATGTSGGRAATWPVPPPPAVEPVEVLRDRYANQKGNSRPVTAPYQ